MNSDGTITLTPQADIRSLIREELSQGLGDFKEHVQEVLRNLLLVDLPRTGMFLQFDSARSDQTSNGNQVVKFITEPPRYLGSVDTADTDRTHETAEKIKSPLLPGIVGEGAQSPDVEAQSPVSQQPTLERLPTATFSQKTSQTTVVVKKERYVCANCNTVFKDNSRFCQSCGVPRQIESREICSCGALLEKDSAFCKKCGRERIASPSDSFQMQSKTAFLEVAAQKKTKKKKGTQFLFKQQDPEAQPTPLQRFTTTRYYEFCSMALIIANSVYIGWETQFLAEAAQDHARRKQALPDAPSGLVAIHVMFCLCFSVELGLRWKADGLLHFFETSDVGWNVLDVFIVGAGILELFMGLVCAIAGWQKTDALKKVSVFRIVRVVRVVRVARAIRVSRFFRELRMMLYSIMGCAKNLIWVLIVLLMTFYIFGVAFTSGVTDYLDTLPKRDDPVNAPLVNYFGTVDKSILSLFMSMSGGNDWSQYYDALALLGLPYTSAFLLFIVFTIFAVVNIVTGVFVESTMQSNTKDKEIVVHEELQEKKEYLQSMAEIFEEMDRDHKGTISMQEFDERLQDERVIAYFSSLKLDVSDARVLFQLLDFDHSGEININEFLDGCYKLQGNSRALDMKIMQYEVRFLSNTLQEIRHEIEVIESRVKSIAKANKGKKVPNVKDPSDQPLPLTF